MPEALIIDHHGSSLVLRGERLVLWSRGIGEIGSWRSTALPFDRVIVQAHGGVVTWPALRMLAERGIPLTVLSFDGQPTTEVLPAGLDRARDLLAQVRAHLDPQRRFEVARFILSEKLGYEPPPIYRTIEDLRLYEAKEAEKEWTKLGIVRERPHARDVRNAALNYGFAILESIVRTAVHRKGLSTTTGFLHVPREGKDSFVYDVMEKFRAAAVRAILSERITARDAYAVFRIGLRLRPTAAKRVAEAVGHAVPARDVEEFLRRLTLAFEVAPLLRPRCKAPSSRSPQRHVPSWADTETTRPRC